MTKDIEIRYTTSEKAVCQFTLAVNRRNKDEADFILCEAWGKVAELLNKYTKKGDRLGVIGHIKVDSYEKDGQRRTMTKVVVDELEFLANKRDSEPVRQTKTEITDNKTIVGFEAVTDEDLPF